MNACNQRQNRFYRRVPPIPECVTLLGVRHSWVETNGGDQVRQKLDGSTLQFCPVCKLVGCFGGDASGAGVRNEATALLYFLLGSRLNGSFVFDDAFGCVHFRQSRCSPPRNFILSIDQLVPLVRH